MKQSKAEEFLRQIQNTFRNLSTPVCILSSAGTLLWQNRSAQQRYPLLSEALEKANLLSEIVEFSQTSFTRSISYGEGEELPLICEPIEDLDRGKLAFLLVYLPQTTKPKDFKLLSHEKAIFALGNQFRTPLMHIFSMLGPIARHIKEQPNNQNMLEYLDIVCSNLYRMLRQCVHLTELSRVINQEVEIQKQPVNINETIRNLAYASEAVLENANIHIECHISPELLLVWADPEKLSVVFLNLLQNACQYGKDETTIHIQIACTSSHAKVTIRDNGRGIPQELLSQITDAYVSYEPDMAPSNSAGLGLFLVKNLIQAMNGSLFLESVLGEGTTVTFTLPLCTKDDEEKPPALCSSLSDLLRDRFSLVYIELAEICAPPSL